MLNVAIYLILTLLLPTLVHRYNREEVVRSLGKEVNLQPPLTLGQLPDTPEELLKLDQVFIKSELKVGVIYVKEVIINRHPATSSFFYLINRINFHPFCIRVNTRKNKS
jgi:hypothetical protein